MNTYLLFAGDYYYPLGGTNDLKYTFDTLEEVEVFIRDNVVDGHLKIVTEGYVRDYDWWHVYSVKHGVCVGFND